MTPRTISVVTAGLRQPSSTRLLADRLAAASVAALDQRGVDAKVDLIELREHAHDLTNNLLAGFPSKRLSDVIDSVVGSAGLIAVTPIFTATYSGLFKTFFDVLEHGTLAGKPVLMAATGGSERHSLALEHGLRPMFAYLRAVTVPTAVYAASSDWGTGSEVGGVLSARIDRAVDEFAALVSGGSTAAQPDPYDELTPFEQLLAGDF